MWRNVRAHVASVRGPRCRKRLAVSINSTSERASTSGADTPDHVTDAGDELLVHTVVQWRATQAHGAGELFISCFQQYAPTMDANNRLVTTVFKHIATSYFDGDHELNKC